MDVTHCPGQARTPAQAPSDRNTPPAVAPRHARVEYADPGKSEKRAPRGRRIRRRAPYSVRYDATITVATGAPRRGSIACDASVHWRAARAAIDLRRSQAAGVEWPAAHRAPVARGSADRAPCDGFPCSDATTRACACRDLQANP